MFESSFKLGRLAGVEIGINTSLLLLAALLSVSMAEGYFPVRLPDYSALTYWALGALTALLFFVSILWHEMGHALIAKYFGMPVHRIVLNLIGGITEIERTYDKPHHAFWLALMGPLSSIALGGALVAAYNLLPAGSPIGEMLYWIGQVNLMLAAFNMLPGFPLDGGYVFQAMLWGWNGNFLKSTRIVTRTGQTFAVMILIYAPLEFMVSGNIFAALSGIFIGWFMWKMAQQNLLQAALRHVPVSNILDHRLTLEKDWTLHYAMDMISLHGAPRTVPVVHDSEYVGVFPLEMVFHIPRVKWGMLRVSHLMRSLGSAPTVTADTDLFATLQKMELNDAEYVVVTQNASPIGILGRHELLTFVEKRRQTVAA